VPEELDPDRPIAVACAGGSRAGTAASLLKLYGAEQVIHVTDGGVVRLGELGVAMGTAG
jgi:rhodanese-related sulfurtransferase